MKFAKQADSFAPPKPKGLENLTEAQVYELAIRYQNRREREEGERRNPRRDPAMQARVIDLYRGLLADLEALPKPKRSPNYRPPARKIEDIEADNAANPIKLS